MGKIYVGTDIFKGGYVSVVKMKKIYVDEPMIWNSWEDPIVSDDNITITQVYTITQTNSKVEVE